MKQMQIYSLPEYDHASDTFKDGSLPKGMDGYFAKSNEHKTYYTDAAPALSH